MRFTTLAVSLLSGLSVFKGVVASPIQPAVVEVQKRASIVEVVNDLKSSVAGPVSVLRSPEVSAGDAQSALQDIVNAISAANAAVPGSTTSVKRALVAAAQGNPIAARDVSVELSERQADDLNIVGQVLAEIITDIVEAIAGLADNLKALPLIGALIIAIDGGLNTLLLGVEIVLIGVIQILQGLLSGLSGLLASLGAGLLAGLLFGLGS